MSSGMNLVVYPVNDLAGATALYTKLLGVAPYMEQPYYRDEQAPKNPARPGYRHLTQSTSPCGTQNQPSSLAAQRSHAWASRARSASVARPCSIARSPKGEAVRRSAQAGPHHDLSCGEA